MEKALIKEQSKKVGKVFGIESEIDFEAGAEWARDHCEKPVAVEFVEKTGRCVNHGDITGFIIIDKDRYYCYKCFEEKVLIPNCEKVTFDG